MLAGLFGGPARTFPALTRGNLPPMRGAVQILRDANGATHVYADDERDRYAAAGWLQAADRFFFLDVIRQLGAGRLCGLLGNLKAPAGLGLGASGRLSDLDGFIRPFGFEAQSRADVTRLTPRAAALLDAFSEGVNAALHAMREHLNATAPKGATPLSYLPFIVAALVRALQRFPQCNAHYDAAREMVLRHRAVHVGIATQTSEGLKVPVVRNADQLKLRALAAEINRVTAAARDRSAKREELSGSTITVTSLGKLGGIASTPIINMPEVAIIGINRVAERPMVVDGELRVRQMMNLSSSFDHRFVDGADAAALIQRLKELLEHPSLIFIDR